MKKRVQNLLLMLGLLMLAACSSMVEDFSSLNSFAAFDVKFYAKNSELDEIDYDSFIHPVINVQNGNPFLFEPIEINGFDFEKKEVKKISKNFYEVYLIYIRQILPVNEAFYEVRFYFEDGKTGNKVLNNQMTIQLIGNVGEEISYSDAEIFSGYLNPVVKNIPSLSANVENQDFEFVEVYYERSTVTYSFDVNGGKWSDGTNDVKTISGKIDSDLIFTEEPVKENCILLDWNPLVPSSFGNTDLLFIAQWKNPASGENLIQDAYSGALQIQIEKSVVMKKFKATCTPPYVGNRWIYLWILDGKKLEVQTNSFESDELSSGEHNIFVSASDGISTWTLNEKVSL